ncbi:Phenylalanyl-trna synthetase [Orbilia blumenaviensis]|uniref:Phenylalanine--tRNA ligase, mitochondrial n=1 Tax=Orbilia blumenaviensis TaxID=1796055 RepID=A0AAV9VGS8_9PEZI
MQASRVFTPLSRRVVFSRQAAANWRPTTPSPFPRPRGFHCTVMARSSSSQTAPSELPNTLTLANITHNTDSHTNIPRTLLPYLTRNLHLTKNHPISNTRLIIESLFPPSTYARYNTLPPVVTVAQNFDCLGFPQDHVGRSRSDTYYVNKYTVLRTHTSAHQAEKFRTLEKEGRSGYLISADVYRRDAIDRSHYPVFHQMEGAKLFDRRGRSSAEVVDEVLKDLEGMEQPNVEVVESCPLFEEEGNPVQTEKGHSREEAEAVGKHLQRQLELMVSKVFSEAALAAGDAAAAKEKVKVRWVSAYFPFTSPSYELEVLWNGEWLEVLGCGVIRQDLLDYAGRKESIGWAFGLGLERIAMLMYGIPDIRLFWSGDERFTNQFKEGVAKRFEAFSKYPQCFKDVAFWLGEGRGAGAAGGSGVVGGEEFHENDFMELVRGIGGDLVEDVKLIDQFTHPKTGRKSMCYRINYRSLERTLTNEEVDELQAKVRSQLEEKMGVQLR